MSVSTDIQELKSILQQYMVQSNKDHQEVKESLVRLETKAVYTKEALDKHGEEIKALNKWKWSNIGTGILALIGLAR